MIISRILGGLGNQMFQYAAGYSLAKRNDCVLKLDLTDFSEYSLHNGFELARIFNISSAVASNCEIKDILGWQAHPLCRKVLNRKFMHHFRKKSFYVEPHYDYWDDFNKIPKNSYLSGYWQSYKYLEMNEAELRSAFRPKHSPSTVNLDLMDKMNVTNSVSIHVRRGDYLTITNSGIHGTCDKSYYHNAIEYFCSKLDRPHFFIFSDDPSWAFENIAKNQNRTCISHNTHDNSYWDMLLMSICKNNIIANSSFSWWAAWLNENSNKSIIAPSRWFADGRSTNTLLPPNWLKI